MNNCESCKRSEIITKRLFGIDRRVWFCWKTKKIVQSTANHESCYERL